MAKYVVTATARDGQTVSRIIQADNPEQAIQAAKKQGLKVTDIRSFDSSQITAKKAVDPAPAPAPAAKTDGDAPPPKVDKVRQLFGVAFGFGGVVFATGGICGNPLPLFVGVVMSEIALGMLRAAHSKDGWRAISRMAGISGIMGVLSIISLLAIRTDLESYLEHNYDIFVFGLIVSIENLLTMAGNMAFGVDSATFTRPDASPIWPVIGTLAAAYLLQYAFRKLQK